ncbi:MAG: DNA-deoxyinosine glycosylase [Anaerolineae bacterium]|nr:DNA-deoxyinosine glycosylase [Anaerolineae bacterium]
MKITSFTPIVTEKSTVLILGSMPGKKSLDLQQYYAHSQNSFWQIMGAICGANSDLPYADRVQQLNEGGIAVWDVLKHCEREGSLDSAIRSDSEVPNDFEQFLETYPMISHIFFNGQKAEKSFRKKVWPNLFSQIRDRITLTTLPSTSPANTQQTREKKIEIWQEKITAVLQTP